MLMAIVLLALIVICFFAAHPTIVDAIVRWWGIKAPKD
jgi:hypothetical protein